MGDENRRYEVDNSALNEPTGNNGTLDLGITGTEETSLLDSYLTNDAATVTTDPKDIKGIDEDDIEEQQPKPTKKDTKKPDFSKEAMDSLSEFLTDDPAEGDDEDPGQAAPTKKAKAKEEPKPAPDRPGGRDEDLDDPETDPGVFGTLSKDLYSLGVFTHDDEEEEDEPITNADEFLEKFNNEKIKQANEFINNFLGRFGEEYREAFQTIFINGVSPKDYFTARQEIDNLADLDMKEPANQKKIFAEYFRRQGLSEDKIEKRLSKAEDLDYLEEESTEYYELLVEQEAKKIEELEYQKAQEFARRQREDQAYAQSLQHILQDKIQKKEFDGIPVTPKEAQETYDYLYTKKWRLPNGEMLTDFDKDILELRNPANHEVKVKLGLLLRSGLDLTRVQKGAISKESKEIFNNLKKQEKTQKRSNPAPTKDSDTSFFSFK